MEIRSTRSFKAIPATIIRGVFLTGIYQICHVQSIVNILFIFHLFLPFSFHFIFFIYLGTVAPSVQENCFSGGRDLEVFFNHCKFF